MTEGTVGIGGRAVLLLAHGTPDALADVPKYLSNVVSGRPMPQTVLDEITHRYKLIGKSPLTALTLEQGRLLSDALGLPVYVGMRNWKPYIADVVRQMRADGVRHAVAICLAPQNSRTSVGLYRRAVFAEAGDAIRVDFVEGWADHPLLVRAFAQRLQPMLAQAGESAAVLFTAHSVPCRTIQTPAAGAVSPLRASLGGGPPSTDAAGMRTPGMVASPAHGGESASAAAGTASAIPGSEWVRSSVEVAQNGRQPTPAPDPYPVEARRTAALVAQELGLRDERWCFAFQSQGMAGGPWIGPTVENTLEALRAAGTKTVVLQTIGFLCDHVEILYDIDIAFREFAEGLGMRLERPASLNDSPLLTEVLVDLARGGLARLEAQAEPVALAEASLVSR